MKKLITLLLSICVVSFCAYAQETSQYKSAKHQAYVECVTAIEQLNTKYDLVIREAKSLHSQQIFKHDYSIQQELNDLAEERRSVLKLLQVHPIECFFEREDADDAWKRLDKIYGKEKIVNKLGFNF